MPVLKLPILSVCSASRSDAQTAQTQGQGGYHLLQILRDTDLTKDDLQ